MRREGKKGKNKAKERRKKEERISLNKKGILNFPIHMEGNSILMVPLEIKIVTCIIL